MSAEKFTVSPENYTTSVPAYRAPQELFESSELKDGAFAGIRPANGLYEFSTKTWDITEPDTEIDYDSIDNEEFPVDGAKHRALVKAAYGALENDIDLRSIGLSETSGHISVVEPDHESGEIDIEVYDFDDAFSEGILGVLDDIRREEIEYLRSDDAVRERDRKYNVMTSAAKTDRDLFEREGDFSEIRKDQEEIVNEAYQFGESFNDTPYSDSPTEDGMGLPYIEFENVEDIEDIGRIAEPMSQNAFKLED